MAIGPDVTSGHDRAPTMDRLVGRFVTPPTRFGPVPIWWWSGDRLTRERLRWQMERMVAAHVHQAIVMGLAPAGPQYGSFGDEPPFMSDEWWALMEGACADAAEVGFTIWLYDQIGFSGANIQGRLVASEPRFAGTAVRRTSRSVGADDRVALTPPGHDAALIAYVVPDGETRPLPLRLAGEGVEYTGRAGRVVLVHSGQSGFDYLSKDACAALIDGVHGEYERRLGGWFGSAIGGFFQDELPAMPSWSPDFAATFQAEYGYDLVPALWALWEDTGDDAAAIRRDYEEHRARLARRAFFDPQAAWFDRIGLVCGFDQVSPAREGDPIGGVEVYGDYLGTHRGYGAPGSDHFGDPKVHSSLAHAFGHEQTWLEAFHSSGWGGTLEETYEWLAPFLRRGATLYDPHAVYYSTRGGWWEWAPPSTCWRQPYWPSYDVFSRAVARLCAVLTFGTHVCDTVLLSPTTAAQAYRTLDGVLSPGQAAQSCFHALNGVNSWAWERPGVLDRASLDYDVLDEAVIASGAVVDGRLVVRDERYRNVVVPAAQALHVSAAEILLELAAGGGNVVCVGAAPGLLLGGDAVRVERASRRLADAVAGGDVMVVGSPDEIVGRVARDRAAITADVPWLQRSVDGVDIVLLAAHDAHTGTAAPILDWSSDNHGVPAFTWERYWSDLRTDGYTFRPTGGRIAGVTLPIGDTRPAQLWDPRTGARTALPSALREDDRRVLQVPLPGPMALVVLGADLPAETCEGLGAAISRQEIAGPWTAEAASSLDNTFGDIAGPDADGIVPLQIWRLEHASAELPLDDDWAPVMAGYGPFAEACGPWSDGEDPGPYAEWAPVEWSLSRGIHKDPYHLDPLGPKAFVPETFLDWRDVPAGDWVAVRTTLAPSGARARLAVTADAERIVLIDDILVGASGAGHLTVSPWPMDGGRRPRRVEIRLRAERRGPVRAAFALVTDVETYRRPEWMVPPSPGALGRVWEFRTVMDLAVIPEDGVVHIGSNGPCGVIINGVTVGRQGDFQAYPSHREVRVHAYDLGAHLKLGLNELALQVVDIGVEPTAALADSAPAQRGGLGLLSREEGWAAFENGAERPVLLRRRHERDPRSVCSWARPHPLPGAHWLDPDAAPGDVIEVVVPDVDPGPERVEHLRLRAPLGTVEMIVPSVLPFRVTVEGTGADAPVTDGRVRFAQPLPAGVLVTLTFRSRDGRRRGALLDGPVTVRTVAARTVLADWEELGLRSLGGSVTYRTSVPAEPQPGVRFSLDLGTVRGTADVRVNGTLVDRLVWSPWTTEITDHLHAGDNDIEVVVRNTLGGYLEDASPTPAVAAGQARAGLYGPVTLIAHANRSLSDEPIRVGDRVRS